MPPNVLDILNDAAHAQLLDSRVAEKKAVLAEAQMMNTIEYRVDRQLLEHLHWDNCSARGFPSQVGSGGGVAGASGGTFTRAVFPGQRHLHVVGDFDATVDEVEDMIETSFGEAAPAEGAEEAGSPSSAIALVRP